MNRLLSRVLKIVTSCILVVGIARLFLNINVMYINRVTCFADVVRSSVLDIRDKMAKLDGCVEADVVSAFGGVRDREFTSVDLHCNIIAECQFASIGLGNTPDCRYSIYRLPFIADYRGLMVVRSNADGTLLDYIIVYDGGGNE